MGSLTKDSLERSPFWICCYRAADGRRLKKSTQQTDKRKSLELCLSIERAEKMARQGTLTESRTRELLSEVLERTTDDTLIFHTVEGFFSDWLRGKEVSKAKNTVRNYGQVVRLFVDHLGARARGNIAAITAKDVASP